MKAQPEGPPVEALMRRLESTGIAVPPKPLDASLHLEHRAQVVELVKTHRMTQTSTQHPLDVLFARGHLTDPRPRNWQSLSPKDQEAFDAINSELAAERHTAGSRFAWLHRRRYPSHHARAVDLGTVSDAGIIMRPQGWNDLTREQQGFWYATAIKTMEQALDAISPEAHRIVIAVAVACQAPTGPASEHLLRKALSALARVRPPTLSAIPSDTEIREREDEARRRFRAA